MCRPYRISAAYRDARPLAHKTDSQFRFSPFSFEGPPLAAEQASTYHIRPYDTGTTLSPSYLVSTGLGVIIIRSTASADILQFAADTRQGRPGILVSSVSDPSRDDLFYLQGAPTILKIAANLGFPLVKGPKCVFRLQTLSLGPDSLHRFTDQMSSASHCCNGRNRRVCDAAGSGSK